VDNFSPSHQCCLILSSKYLFHLALDILIYSTLTSDIATPPQRRRKLSSLLHCIPKYEIYLLSSKHHTMDSTSRQPKSASESKPNATAIFVTYLQLPGNLPNGPYLRATTDEIRRLTTHYNVPMQPLDAAVSSTLLVNSRLATFDH
jgi:hypothetical protein